MRSRAVFKLEEADKRRKLPNPGAICLDLGDAGGVELAQGGLREREVFDGILAILPERRVDLVLSDIAPQRS